MTAGLCGIALVAGAALAGVNILTEEPIAEAQAAARRQAIAEVLPQFDNNPADEAYEYDGLTLFPAKMSGADVGMAVETYSDNGFSGRFTILAGFDMAGRLTGYRVLSHAETPGLGARMSDWFSEDGTQHSAIGHTMPFGIKADGGDIDAITGATITSRAFMEALNKAAEACANSMTDR
ncbi:MAG: RnfABCDGE type electron transport complex subunit G [Muribaculaceae bacterium]|nr:RnfABCDGE type electron transport complex subunit G [Muribaculaceae bacterium]